MITKFKIFEEKDIHSQDILKTIYIFDEQTTDDTTEYHEIGIYFTEEEFSMNDFTTQYPNNPSGIFMKTVKLEIDKYDFLSYENYDDLAEYLEDNNFKDLSEIPDENLMDYIKNNDWQNYILDEDFDTIRSWESYFDYLDQKNESDTSKIEELIKIGKNFEIKNYMNETPLLQCTSWGYYNLGKLLIDAGADVNFQDNIGLTPLMIAIGFNERGFFDLLLDEAEIDLDKTNNDDETALIVSILYDRDTMTEDLIKADVSIWIQDEESHSALYYACTKNKLKIAKMLLDKGADINVLDDYDNNILYNVLYEDAMELMPMIEFLIKKGLEFDFDDTDSEEVRKAVSKLKPKEYEEYKLNKNLKKYKI